jgi:hypothetical protein
MDRNDIVVKISVGIHTMCRGVEEGDGRADDNTK